MSLRSALPWWLLAVAILIVDQLTKVAAEQQLGLHQPVAVLPFFNLTLMYNEGAAFSFLSDAGGWQRWFFITLSSGVSIGLIVWLARLPRNQRWLALALSLVLAGAVGNLIDRLIYGHVIDFIQVYYQQWYWPTFNVADSAITVGAALLIIDALFVSGRNHKESGPRSGP